jgi:hypothetical protein
MGKFKGCTSHVVVASLIDAPPGILCYFFNHNKLECLWMLQGMPEKIPLAMIPCANVVRGTILGFIPNIQ